jgi:hypothetical protein
MRKVLIISALLAGAGLLTAAHASEDRSRPAKEGSQPTVQSESIDKDCKRSDAARDDRSHESSEKYREAQREHDDDEDRE